MNLAVGGVKLAGAAGSAAIGPWGAIGTVYLTVGAVGNIGAGTFQLLGAGTGQIADASQAATAATTLTTAAGFMTYMRTGDLRKASSAANAESLGTAAVNAGLSGNIFDKGMNFLQKTVLSTELGQNLLDAVGLNTDGTCK